MPVKNNVEYYIPKNLLGTKNVKTIKGEKMGFTTYIMYLAPAKQNDFNVNLCSHASKGCEASCLFKSGAARFNKIQLARINKSNYFIANKQRFLRQLYHEINYYKKIHNNMTTDVIYNSNGEIIRNKKFAIRLNGSSDISFETLKIINNKNIFELFSDIQFYDYTKKPLRMVRNKMLNYHLTFSRSETNNRDVLRVLNNGGNVAVVFGVKDVNNLPKMYLGHKVVNGDLNDLRFLDDKNVIVGLKYKNVVTKGNSNLNTNKFDSGFVVNVKNLTLEFA